jgi:hypothetical protein
MAKLDAYRIFIAVFLANVGATFAGRLLSPSLSPLTAAGLSYFASYSVAGFWVLHHVPDAVSRAWRAVATGAIAGVVAAIIKFI